MAGLARRPLTATAADPAVAAAYRACLTQARRHYENFPVASRLLPPRLRAPVAALYAFARRADDWADEGDLTPAQRLEGLEALDAALQRIAARRSVGDDPALVALQDAVHRHGLPVAELQRLLEAFRLDVTKRRYADFAELEAYCQCSANPVGRVLLHLYDAVTSVNVERSDAICTALQLINFLQDIRQDLDEHDRIYLPEDERAAFGVTECMLRAGDATPELAALMGHQTRRARRLLNHGAPLAETLGGRAGLELRLIVHGAGCIVERLEAGGGALLRPRLTAADWCRAVWRTMWRTTLPRGRPPPGVS